VIGAQTLDQISTEIQNHANEIKRISGTVMPDKYGAQAAGTASSISTKASDALALAQTLKTILVPGTGRSINVPAGGDLQRALNEAQSGDTIYLQAGARYVGNYKLPAKTGDQMITLTSSAVAELPAGRRVTPAVVRSMATIVTPNDWPAITAGDNAHHYRLIGLEITVAPNVYTFDIIRLEAKTLGNLAAYPHTIELDRVWVHGDPVVGSKRGIAMNSLSTTIVNSYCSDFKSSWQETYCISSALSPGPFRLENNYFAAAGVNVIFGGGKPAIDGLVPSYITIIGNHFHKPVEWRGQAVAVKNLLELKSAHRVLIRGNVLENSWPSAQVGFAVLFTVPSCQDGDFSWAVVKDVVFESNIVRHAAYGINLLARDENGSACVAGEMSNISIRQNVMYDIGTQWGGGGEGAFVQIIDGVDNLTVDHNTMIGNSKYLTAGNWNQSRKSQNFVFTNNLLNAGSMHLGNLGGGTEPLEYYMPGYVFTNNGLVGSYNASLYPANNFYLTSSSQIGYVNSDAGVFALSPGSPWKGKGSYGTDIGADIAAVLQATAGVVQ
jgi:hypothetical protein